MNSEYYSKAFLTLTIFLYAGFASLAYNQSVADKAIYQAFDTLVSRENTGLYNGPQFIANYPNSWDDSHVYLVSANYQKGTLVYHNQWYTEVPLRYDLIEDNISIRSNDYLSAFKIRVDPNSITSFLIHDRKFIKLWDTGIDLRGNGFFEIAFAGKTVTLYIKHVKRIKRETVDKVPQQRFINDNYYLIWENDTYYLIQSWKDFKKVSPDRYAQVRNFYQLNRSLFKNTPDDFMVKLMAFLDANKNS
jgi:hypothetical protein